MVLGNGSRIHLHGDFSVGCEGEQAASLVHECLDLLRRKDRGCSSAEIQGIDEDVTGLDQRHLLQEGLDKRLPKRQVRQGIEVV